MGANPEPPLIRIEFDVCQLCLTGAGGECHTPGCAFWMDSAPTGAGLVPDPETPPGLWLGPIVDGVQTYGAYLRDIPAEGWVVRTDDGPIWTDAAGVATDDSVWVQARRRPAATPTTRPDRWMVREAEHPVAGLSWDLLDRGEYVGSLVSIDASIRLRDALNAADPGPDTTPVSQTDLNAWQPNQPEGRS